MAVLANDYKQGPRFVKAAAATMSVAYRILTCVALFIRRGPVTFAMLASPETVNAQTPEPAERRFTLGYWLVLAGVVLVAAFLLYPGIAADDEGVSRIDHETAVIRVALNGYKTEFGAFPSGDSRAICRALAGNNPKRIQFIELKSVSPDGHFLDQWGTPYKIYYSGDRPLVRSAGPNKQFDPSTKRKQTDDYFGG